MINFYLNKSIKKAWVVHGIINLVIKMKEVDIIQKIKNNYNNFSKSHKIVADYLIKYPEEIPFVTLQNIEENTNISLSTVSRFSKAIGYENFSELQKAFRLILPSRVQPFEEIKRNISSISDNILFSEIEYAINSLEHLYSDELKINIEYAARLMNDSNKIYILGSRTSRSAALFMYYMLCEITSNVFLLENINDDISFKLQELNEKDLLFAISYSKYTNLTIKLISYFKDRNLKVISLTDFKISPIAEKSDIVLTAVNSNNTFTNVATITTINAIIMTLSNIIGNKSIDRMNRNDIITEDLNLYYD